MQLRLGSLTWTARTENIGVTHASGDFVFLGHVFFYLKKRFSALALQNHLESFLNIVARPVTGHCYCQGSLVTLRCNLG